MGKAQERTTVQKLDQPTICITTSAIKKMQRVLVIGDTVIGGLLSRRSREVCCQLWAHICSITKGLPENPI